MSSWGIEGVLTRVAFSPMQVRRFRQSISEFLTVFAPETNLFFFNNRFFLQVSDAGDSNANFHILVHLQNRSGFHHGKYPCSSCNGFLISTTIWVRALRTPIPFINEANVGRSLRNLGELGSSFPLTRIGFYRSTSWDLGLMLASKNQFLLGSSRKQIEEGRSGCIWSIRGCP